MAELEITESYNYDLKDKKSEIINGAWYDKKGNKIKKANLGDEVKFYITVQDIDAGETVDLSLFEKNVFQKDTDLSERYACKIDGKGQGNITLKLDKKWSKYLDETGEGDELEIYFKAEYGKIKKNLSTLEVYDTALITVLIELPHSKETDKLNAKGLAGHTGIIVNDDYYDFGPTPGQGADFSSKGRPWWDKKSMGGHNPNFDLKRNNIMSILSSANNRKDVFITGRVVLIDIFVTEVESEKVEKWWKDKYADLGNYSVWIVSGEQCTTTVKNSLAGETKIFTLDWVDTYLSKDETVITQSPEGFLNLLTTYGKHTSGPKRGETLTITKNYPEL